MLLLGENVVSDLDNCEILTTIGESYVRIQLYMAETAEWINLPC